VQLLLSGNYNGTAAVARELHSKGLTPRILHGTTVARHAKTVARVDGAPIVAKRGKPVKQLTDKNCAQRVKFCKDNKTRNWDNVMVTDRKKFLFRYPGASVKPCSWVRVGDTRECNQVNKPSCVNMYCGITKYGVTKPHFVTGTTGMASKHKNAKGQASRNITISEYREVMASTLIPEGKQTFLPAGSERLGIAARQ
jgi:hypothetical protein